MTTCLPIESVIKKYIPQCRQKVCMGLNQFVVSTNPLYQYLLKIKTGLLCAFLKGKTNILRLFIGMSGKSTFICILSEFQVYPFFQWPSADQTNIHLFFISMTGTHHRSFEGRIVTFNNELKQTKYSILLRNQIHKNGDSLKFPMLTVN